MKLIFLIFFTAVVIVGVKSQFNGFPTYNLNNLNDPNHPCNQPGANCKIQSRFAEENSVSDNHGSNTNTKFTRVCDERGCIESRVSSGSSDILTNIWMLTTVTFIIVIKNFVK